MTTVASSRRGEVKWRTAFAALYQLHLRDCASTRRLIVLAVCGSLLVLGLSVGSSGSGSVVSAGVLHFSAGDALALTTFYVPLVVVLVASLPLGRLRSAKALGFVWLTPTPRWLVCSTAMAASLTITLPMATLGALIVAASRTRDFDSGSAAFVLAMLVASVLSALVWSALVVAASLVFRRVVLWALLYLFLIEGDLLVDALLSGSVSRPEGGWAFLILGEWLRGFVLGWLDADAVGFSFFLLSDAASSVSVTAVNPLLGAGMLLGMTVLFVVLGAWRLNRMSFD